MKPQRNCLYFIVSTVFSREIFPFFADYLLHVHTGLNFQTGMYEYAKVQLLLIKFNTRTLKKKYTLSSSDVDFENFGVLGTTLTKIR